MKKQERHTLEELMRKQHIFTTKKKKKEKATHILTLFWQVRMRVVQFKSTNHTFMQNYHIFTFL